MRRFIIWSIAAAFCSAAVAVQGAAQTKVQNLSFGRDNVWNGTYIVRLDASGDLTLGPIDQCVEIAARL